MICLSSHDRQVLNTLEDVGASTTRAIADQVGFRFGHNNHTQSAYVLGILRDLERHGYVRRLDEEKPIAWLRVAVQEEQ